MPSALEKSPAKDTGLRLHPLFQNLSKLSQEALREKGRNLCAEGVIVSGNFVATHFLGVVTFRDGQSLSTIGSLQLETLPEGAIASLALKLWDKTPLSAADFDGALDDLGHSSFKKEAAQ